MQVYSNKNAMYVCTVFLYVLISYQMKLMLLVTGQISNGKHLPNEEGVCDAFVKLAASQ